MSNLDHIVLYTLLFGVFYFITRLKQKTINKHFNAIIAIPISLYSFIVGSRYWGADFEWYKLRFENPFYYPDEDPGFFALNMFLNELGLDYTGAYTCYALMLIISAYILCKNFTENKYMLALYLPATLMFTSDIIRQSVAYSFVLVALNSLNKKNYILYVIMMALSYTIHPIMLIIGVLCTIIYFLSNVTGKLPYIITIPIYLVLTISTQIFNEYISEIFTTSMEPMLGIMGGKFAGYSENVDIWFGDDAIKTEWEQGVIALLLNTLFNCSIIYLGYITLKYKPHDTVKRFYNIVVIGIIAQKAFSLFELLRRVAMPLYMLYFIPLGYAIFYIPQNLKKLQARERIISYLSIASIVVYLLAYWGRFIFLSPQYIFSWQKYL